LNQSVVATAPAVRSISAVRPSSRRTRPASDRRQAAPGRYKELQNARVPANGFASSRSATNVPTTVGVVQDPYSPKEKIAVSVNRRVDLLEWEYSHGRLSEAAYRTGRIVQAIFERATGRSQSSWSAGDRVDAFCAKELQILTALEKAEAIRHHMARIVTAIGQVGARFLRDILGENKTYSEMAAARGQTDTSFTAKRFRNLLEDLAEEWAAVGQSRA
jgi:hypothetical protein